MHGKRWLTGLVAIPLLIALLTLGSALHFTLLVGVVSLLALREYFGIVFSHFDEPVPGGIPAIAYAMSLMVSWAAYRGALDSIPALIVLDLLIIGIVGVTRFKNNTAIPAIIARQVLGVIYVPIFLSYFVLLRNSADGASWVLFVLVVIFAGDTGAFYAGSYLGSRKLIPSVSPGKTVEGAIGGVAANLVAGSFMKAVFLQNLPWVPTLVTIVVIGVAGQFGDLFESVLKRSGNIKDSGTLLPGHGGILDRIDAVLFAVPLTYFSKIYWL